MQQHVFDDGIGTFAVLHDLVEIAAATCPLVRLISLRLFSLRLTSLNASCNSSISSAGDPREIVDEIERVLDLVGDASRELAERGELLRLHQAVLCGAQILQRGSQLARSRFDAFE